MKTQFLRSTLLAALIAAMSGASYAAGLGRISVFSSLGQPLKAEVEIAATPEELDGMTARIAPLDAFKRANIEYDGLLASVKMAVERRANNSAVVRISSDRSFPEPFVDLLIELNWTGGRLLREYTFLLDPAEIGEQKAAVETVTRPDLGVSASPAPAKASNAPARSSTRAKAASSKPVETEEEKPESGDYRVKNGDTLNGIASSLKSSEVSTQQMLAALYKANEEAFINGNINRLRAGKILKVPEAAEAQAISKSEAREIVLNASNFDSYRKSVASAAAASNAQQPAATQSSTGKIAPKVAESAPLAAAGQGQLKISQSKDGKPDANATARVQSLQEELATRNKALQDANGRLADLEKNVKELQKLVDMKNQNLAELQKQAEASKQLNKKADTAAQKAAKDAEEAKQVAAAKEAEAARVAAAKEAETARLAAEKEAEDARKAAEAAKEAEAARAAEASKAAEEAKLTAAKDAEIAASSPVVVETAPAEQAPAASAPVVTPPPAPAPTVAEEDDGLLSNPLALGGLLVALLGAGYVFMRNRKRNAKNTGLTMSALSEASTSPNSVFGNAGGQTVDTGTSVLHTDFSQSGLSAIDTDEGVDPVAEADVYMAYGRDAQAEEILLDALKHDPSRAAIYVKLLEIYSQRRSLKQFENIATDLFTQTGGAGDDWAKAAALGSRLDPTNPLYRTNANAEGGAPGLAAAPALAAGAAVAVERSIANQIEQAAAAEEPPPAVTFGTNNVSQMRATWTVPGEISQFDASKGDAPRFPEVAAAAASNQEPLNLDFNLDLELPEGDEPETRMEPRDDQGDLPGLDDVVAKPVVRATDSMNPLEFDIDLGMETETEGRAFGSPASSAMPVHMDSIDTDEMGEVDLGIERAMAKTNLSVVDLEKTNFEGSLLDFDFELGEDTRPDDRSLDLSSMNLRTDGKMTATSGIQAPVTPAPAAPATASNGVAHEALENIDLNDEIATKLELARAYEEMGDLEGARELLEEVMADGGDSQKDMARTIMSRIS